jgi:hypothetical protein
MIAMINVVTPLRPPFGLGQWMRVRGEILDELNQSTLDPVGPVGN